MFFNDIAEVQNFAPKTHCLVLVAPLSATLQLKNVLEYSPELESVREINVNMKQLQDQFIVISPADKMGEVASNMLLKTLEEPAEYYHFILRTEKPSAILPTILSRSEVFILKRPYDFDSPIQTDKKIHDQAQKLLVANPEDLLELANEIVKKDDEARPYTLEIIATTIEILYKSYFKTRDIKWANLLPKYLKLYENIAANGHIKTHLIADLL